MSAQGNALEESPLPYKPQRGGPKLFTVQTSPQLRHTENRKPVVKRLQRMQKPAIGSGSNQ